MKAKLVQLWCNMAQNDGSHEYYAICISEVDDIEHSPLRDKTITLKLPEWQYNALIDPIQTLLDITYSINHYFDSSCPKYKNHTEEGD